LEARRLLVLVESRVDLDRRHMAAGIMEFILLLEVLGVELSLAPFRKDPAGHAGANSACHVSTARLRVKSSLARSLAAFRRVKNASSSMPCCHSGRHRRPGHFGR